MGVVRAAKLCRACGSVEACGDASTCGSVGPSSTVCGADLCSQHARDPADNACRMYGAHGGLSTVMRQRLRMGTPVCKDPTQRVNFVHASHSAVRVRYTRSGLSRANTEYRRHPLCASRSSQRERNPAVGKGLYSHLSCGPHMTGGIYVEP